MWYIIYGLLLLVLGTCVWITIKKVRKDIYNPYYLKHVLIGYGFAGALFLVASFILFLIQI